MVHVSSKVNHSCCLICRLPFSSHLHKIIGILWHSFLFIFQWSQHAGRVWRVCSPGFPGTQQRQATAFQSLQPQFSLTFTLFLSQMSHHVQPVHNFCCPLLFQWNVALIRFIHCFMLEPTAGDRPPRSPGVDPKQLAAELQKVSQQQAPTSTSSSGMPTTASATSSPGQPGSPSVNKKRHSSKVSSGGLF